MYENVTISVELQGSNFLAHARLKGGNCLVDGWAFDCDIATAQKNAVSQAIQNQALCNGNGGAAIPTTEDAAKESVQISEQISEKSEAESEAGAVSMPEPTGVPAGWPFGNVDVSCIPDDVKSIMPEQPKQPEPTVPTESAPSASPVSAESEAKPKKNPKKESVELTEEQVAARNVSSGGIIEKYGDMTLGEIFDEDKDAICFLASDLAEAPENVQEAAAILVSLMGK